MATTAATAATETPTTPQLTGVVDLFKASWETTRARLKNYWIAALALFGIFLATIAVTGLLGTIMATAFAKTSSIALGTGIGLLILVALAIIIAIGVWWSLIALEIISGQDLPSFSLAVRRTKPLIWPLFLLQLILIFIVLGMTAFLYLPLLYLFVPMSFIVMVFYFEKFRGLAAFYRSLDLIAGHFWGVLGRILVIWIAQLLIQQLISGVFNSGIAALLNLAFIVIWAPLAIAYFYHLYLSLAAINPAPNNRPNKHTGWMILSTVGWVIGLLALTAIIGILATNPSVRRAIQAGKKLEKQLQNNPESRQMLENLGQDIENGQLDKTKLDNIVNGNNIQKMMEQQGYSQKEIDDTIQQLNNQQKTINQQLENYKTNQ